MKKKALAAALPHVSSNPVKKTLLERTNTPNGAITHTHGVTDVCPVNCDPDAVVTMETRS